MPILRMCGNYYMFSNIPCEFRDAFCLSFTDLSSWTPDRGPLSMVLGRSLNFEVGGIIDDDKHLLSHPLLVKSSDNYGILFYFLPQCSFLCAAKTRDFYWIF
ncbi:unnamed protein product, partial [Vitis vinifera]|uniref:Uncharacterized protein n=1 Tax=Vitis vinifera TaxID=29760 RepID=D7TIH6_VITVI